LNLDKVKNILMLIVCGSMMIMGFYMIYEGMLHEVGGETESHAEVSLLHLGKVTGNQRIIIMAFGMLLIFLSAKFLWRIDIKKTLKKGKVGLFHYATPIGKEIARRMRLKDRV
jgi:hypothetical protein